MDISAVVADLNTASSDLKAVNIWYQNKRRSMKKKLAAWRDAENTSRSSSAASLAEPKTNPVLRRNPSYTLDSVASSRERRDNRPPLRPRHHVPNYADDLHDDYDDYDDLGIPENIYELIPSSPPQPPSSPGAECVFLSGLPPDSKTMRSLEWACAKDRAVRRKRVKERRRRRGEENADVPELDLDEGLSSEADFDDLITPDTSLQSIAAGLLKPSPRKPKTKAGDGRARADEEAAHVLLAFRRA